MMANWEMLNKEFEQVLNNLTDEAWDSWASQREAKKAMRRQELLLKAKMQEEKIYFNKLVGIELFKGELLINVVNPATNIIFSSSVSVVAAGENNYALAA